MKKLIAILTVVLFANQASADQEGTEYLCSAWEGDLTAHQQRPFILTKSHVVFDNPYGLTREEAQLLLDNPFMNVNNITVEELQSLTRPLTLSFTNPYGVKETATQIGRYNHYYEIYLTAADKNGESSIYYYSDHEVTVEDLLGVKLIKLTLISRHEADCYRK
tara:strand:- start:582 stop:1070 length:489 start_codon:yes stop_codon:yes gene_type:complete